MSRIGKKPIPLPAGVKYKVEGNTVLVEGPKGKVSALIAEGITLKTADGHLAGGARERRQGRAARTDPRAGEQRGRGRDQGLDAASWTSSASATAPS